VLILLGVVAVAGVAAFAYLTLGRYGTPFVVASKVGLGGLVFLVGRLALVGFHELAHGLTLASFGRPVRSAGLKLMLIFPFAYVDSSLVHDLPRQRRVAVSIAGPASDFVLGGTFALLSFAAAGTVRDVLFQLALAGYVGALFNLNPLLDRDGYHVLSDLLGEDDLRGRSRLWLERRLRGEPTGEGGRRLAVYAIAGLVWMVGALGFVVVLSLVAYQRLSDLLPEPIVLAALGILYLLLLVPVGLVVVRPLWSRTRRRPAAEAMDG
jgi:putative peptide zinc metalloprotease protein